jgi:hypothetical protein
MKSTFLFRGGERPGRIVQMKKLLLAPVFLLILSASAAENPIRLEGQIRQITQNGGDVTVRLHRDRYPIVMRAGVTRVRWLDGRRAHPGDLLVGDSIRVEGNLEKNVIYADRVTLLLRIEHRGGEVWKKEL